MNFRPAKFEVTILRRFEEQPVRSLAFEFERRFRPYISADVNVATVAPNAPPNQVRFQMSDGKRTLAVSEISAQLTMDFGTSVTPKFSLLKALEKPTQMMRDADQLFDPSKRFYRAVLIQAALPYAGPSEELADKLAALMFKTVPTGSISSSEYSIAVKDGEINKNANFSQYNLFDMMIQMQIGPQIVGFDPDFTTPSETGLQYKIDVNNKAGINDAARTDYDKLLSEAVEFFNEDIFRKVTSLPSLT